MRVRRIQDFHWGGAASPGGAVFRGRHHGQKDAFSCQKGASADGRGAPSKINICFEGCRHGRKGRPFVSEVRLARRHTYNAFDAKIDPGLRYSANGDESWRPCAEGAGASGSIGEGLPAPAAPPWIRPCAYRHIFRRRGETAGLEGM